MLKVKPYKVSVLSGSCSLESCHEDHIPQPAVSFPAAPPPPPPPPPLIIPPVRLLTVNSEPSNDE